MSREKRWKVTLKGGPADGVTYKSWHLGSVARYVLEHLDSGDVRSAYYKWTEIDEKNRTATGKYWKTSTYMIGV